MVVFNIFFFKLQEHFLGKGNLKQNLGIQKCTTGKYEDAQIWNRDGDPKLELCWVTLESQAEGKLCALHIWFYLPSSLAQEKLSENHNSFHEKQDKQRSRF